ncbi:MAG: DUF4130 domain-containing protein [Candidatus Altiarchaeota archaeon]
MRRRGWKRGGVFDLVRRHREFDQRLCDAVAKQDPSLVENCATSESRKLYEMQRSVLRCMHLKKGFMRLKISEHGILYAKTNLEHDVADLILNHFHNRFPTFHIALEHDKVTDVIQPDGRIIRYNLPLTEVLPTLESKLPRNPTLNELSNDEGLWETYYDSQQIMERDNPKLQQKMMPLKYRDKDALETAKSKRSHNLLTYLIQLLL